MVVARSNSGEIWEFFVAVAIVLHCLAGSAHVYLAAGAGSRVDRVVRCDQTDATWDALVRWVAQRHGHLLVLPSLATFPGVDLVEAVDGIVGEYQLKASRLALRTSLVPRG